MWEVVKLVGSSCIYTASEFSIKEVVFTSTDLRGPPPWIEIHALIGGVATPSYLATLAHDMVGLVRHEDQVEGGVS